MNSVNELRDYLKDKLKDCPNFVFFDKTLENMFLLISKRPLFDYNKFVEWFDRKNLSNPLAFLAKCATQDISRGLFDLDKSFKDCEETLNIIELFNAMRNNNVSVEHPYDTYIGVYEQYIYSEKLLTIEELKKWNREAISYVKSIKGNSAMFFKLFMASKTMQKLKLPYDKLNGVCQKEVNEWDELISQIEATKPNTEFTAISQEELEAIKLFLNEEESETYNEKE